MNRKVTYVYRCRNCGQTFYGDEPIRCIGTLRPESVGLDHNHHDTHKCTAFGKEAVHYGVGDLVGCFMTKAKRDDRKDGGGDAEN